LCVSSCGPREQCVKDSDNPHQLKCCPDDKVLGGLCCSSIVNGECCTTMGQCCSPDTPLWDTTGLCHSCTEDTLITVENAYLCGAICENRTVMSGKYCTLKCNENEFKDIDGKCRKCTDAGNYYTFATKAECDKCPERVFGYVFNDKCMLKCGTLGTYTEDKPLYNSNGICFSCNTRSVVSVDWGDKSRCETICPNRTLDGNNCIFRECSAGMFSGNDQVCYDCGIVTPIATTKNECDRCLNREYGTDGYCGLKNI